MTQTECQTQTPNDKGRGKVRNETKSQPHSRADAIFFVCELFLSFWSFFSVTFFVFSFGFLLLFSFFGNRKRREEGREHEVSWVGRWVGSGKSLGRRKQDQHKLYENMVLKIKLQ